MPTRGNACHRFCPDSLPAPAAAPPQGAATTLCAACAHNATPPPYNATPPAHTPHPRTMLKATIASPRTMLGGASWYSPMGSVDVASGFGRSVAFLLVIYTRQTQQRPQATASDPTTEFSRFPGARRSLLGFVCGRCDRKRPQTNFPLKTEGTFCCTAWQPGAMPNQRAQATPRLSSICIQRVSRFGTPDSMSTCDSHRPQATASDRKRPHH